MKIPVRKILTLLVLSVAVEAFSLFIGSTYVPTFLKGKIVELLVTLMAINTATSTFLVAKLQEIGKEYNTTFKSTYNEIKLSLMEQIFLIVIAVLTLTILDSSLLKPVLSQSVRVAYVFDVILIFVFVAAIDILRDTGVAMFNILLELEDLKK